MHKTEAETRQDIINKRLFLARWDVTDHTHVTEELDIDLTAAGAPKIAEPETPYEGHQFVDYGLLHNGKPLAVVEAKKTSKDAAAGQEQALQYAQNLQKIHGGRLPFIFYTNGHKIYFWESDFYPPVEVYGFPTREDLEWFDQRRQTRRPLSVELINTKIVERDYQIAAIRSVLEGIEAKRQKCLLVMATGTGKTRTAVALIDVLKRAHWAKRILFLVDRIALQEQALDAFEEHLPSEPRWPKKGGEDFKRDRRIYVCTYPTMLNIIQNGKTPKDWISPFYFDVVIADESHRSIYNIYKEVLSYFHAIKIGLTATPTNYVDHDTFDLFDCETGVPTFAYAYEEATSHTPSYLNDFEVLNVRSKFQIEGIKGKELSEEDKTRLIEEGIDIEEVNFEGTDLEKKVTNSGTNALIIREFMESCIKDPTGTIPGKSIIFAISKGHARRLQDVFDKLYPEHKGKLARVLVSDDRYVYGKGGLLDQFKTQDMPRVAISVDMLDTGVDVLEITNLVFAKPIFSYVKFWQMIGRGTRVLDANPAKRKPWCTEKEKFLIIDCWANFEYFKMKPKGVEPDTQIPLPVILFRSRLQKLKAAMSARLNEVVKSVIKDLRSDIADLPQNSVTVLEKKSELAAVEVDEFWNRIDSKSIDYLNSVIAPIMRARSGADFKAMRFEISIVDLGTENIKKNNDAVEAIKASIIEQVSELPLSVNVVAKEKGLIEDVLSSNWWAAVEDEKLNTLVRRLSPLMKFRRKPPDPIMHLNLEDLLVKKDWIEFGPNHERIPTAEYKERVEGRVKKLLSENMVLQKIQKGETVSKSEIHKLAEILRQQDPYVTEELLQKVYDHKSARFIQFMRHIFGLEKLEPWPDTVTKAFDDFIKTHNNFTTYQIHFLQILRTFIIQTGRVEKKNLVEPPFTQLHPKGIRGVFEPRQIDEILKFTEQLVA